MSTAPSVPMPVLLTANEVAQLLGLSVDTIKDWCRSGKLRHVRLSPHVLRIRQADLAEFLEKAAK